MKNRGFTLIELVIVMVLIGITSVIGMRFISDMAHSQASTAERSQALAGARFAMERLRRELSQAYSPSVYVSNDGGLLNSCINFVPVIAAGSYTGSAKDSNAKFILPFNVTAKQLALANMAINATNIAWSDYPASPLPNSVAAIKLNLIAPDPETNTLGTRGFVELFADSSPSTASAFENDESKRRYTLLKREQVRFCLQGSNLVRQVKSDKNWPGTGVIMLQGIQANKLFGEYDKESQLLTLDLNMKTRDGDLALSSQLQVNYGP